MSRIFAFVFCLSLGLILPVTAACADPGCVRELEPLPLGSCVAVDYLGEYGVVVLGRQLQVIDLSDLAAPATVAKLNLPFVPAGFAVDAQIAIAAGPRGSQVIDLSHQEAPAILADITIQNACGVDLSNDIAYIGTPEAVHIVDISDPADPQTVKTLEFEGACVLDIEGDRLLITHGNTVQVIDISDPAEPNVVGALPEQPQSPLAISSEGDIAVILLQTSVLVVDVSDPSFPVTVGVFETEPPPWMSNIDVQVTEGYAFIADYQMVRILDISDPAAPAEVATWAMRAMGIAVNETQMLVSDLWAGYQVLELDSESEAEIVYRATVKSPGQSRDVALMGTTAIAADWQRGLRMINIGEQSEVIGEINDIRGVGQLEIVEEIAWATTSSSGQLHRISLQNPDQLEFGDPADWISSAHEMAAFGETLFVSYSYGWHSHSIEVVDVSSYQPEPLGNFGGRAAALAANSYILAVSNPYTDAPLIILYDVSNLNEPVVSSVLEDIETWDLAITEDLLYAADSQRGMVIIDIVNSQAPFIVSQTEVSSGARAVAVLGGIATVTSMDGQVLFFDIVDPSDPRQLAVFEAHGEALKAAAGGPYSVIADGEAGLRFFDFSLCQPEPTRASFDLAPRFPRVREQVVCRDTSTGFPTSWDWRFHQNTSQTQQHAIVDWREPGSYWVTLNVDGGELFDWAWGEVHVQPDPSMIPPPTEPRPFRYVIPAVAHTDGAQGTRWRSDVVMLNPGTDRATIDLFLLASGIDGRNASSVRVEIYKESSIRIEDVVRHAFGETSIAGALLVASDQPLIVTSKAFTGSAGTYGQGIPAEDFDQAFTTDDVVILPHLEGFPPEDPSFRSNIGIVNLSDHPVRFSVQLRSEHGWKICDEIRPLVPAFSHLQVSNVFAGCEAPRALGSWATVTTSSKEAFFFAYASVVDNISGDPIYRRGR